MIDLKLAVETVQKIRNAENMEQASAPVIAILEGQLARETKYSDLLQSHHSLCGQVAELKEKVAAASKLADQVAQWVPVIEAAKRVRAIRQEASREAGRLGVEFSYEKFRKEHEDACTALDVAVWKLSDWERKIGQPGV